MRLVTPAGTTSVHHNPMARTATASTRLPASGSPAGAGAATIAAQTATNTAAIQTER
jgi:hypothetical protein